MMFVSFGLIVALLVIVGFIAVFSILDKYGFLERYSLEMSGPFLMWKTEKGKKLIDRISEKKDFWKNYGSLGIVIVVISMVIILFLVVWSAILASSIPKESAPSPRMVLGIPGINPLIPIWYGILGLAVAIIIHEFSHGILARVADIKIKTLGLIFLVVPMGAFVEPDEEEMQELSKMKRDRIYAVGPTSNVLLAVVLALIFSTLFMGSVSPKQDGLVINGIYEGSPADISGMDVGAEVISIGGTRIRDFDELLEIEMEPGEEVEVVTTDGDVENSYYSAAGLSITDLVEGYPADDAGLEEGDLIYGLDDTVIRNYHGFDETLEDTSPSIPLNISYFRYEDGEYNRYNTSIVLKDKYESYEELYPGANKKEFKGQGYMGVSVSYMGLSVWDVEFVPNLMAHPYKDAETANDYFMSSLRYISIPFLKLSPMSDDMENLYQVNGPLAALPDDAFWMISNSLYWIFWLNLMVGLFNALPAVPLDGGFIFKDGITSLAEKFNLKEDKKEIFVHGFTYLIALTILAMLLWQLIGPRI
ncbi:MAG: site-2 protease family protein [Thermoplasmata archaeon]